MTTTTYYERCASDRKTGAGPIHGSGAGLLSESPPRESRLTSFEPQSTRDTLRHYKICGQLLLAVGFLGSLVFLFFAGTENTNVPTNSTWIRDLTTEGIEPNPGPGKKIATVSQQKGDGKKRPPTQDIQALVHKHGLRLCGNGRPGCGCTDCTVHGYRRKPKKTIAKHQFDIRAFKKSQLLGKEKTQNSWGFVQCEASDDKNRGFVMDKFGFCPMKCMDPACKGDHYHLDIKPWYTPAGREFKDAYIAAKELNAETDAVPPVPTGPSLPGSALDPYPDGKKNPPASEDDGEGLGPMDGDYEATTDSKVKDEMPDRASQQFYSSTTDKSAAASLKEGKDQKEVKVAGPPVLRFGFGDGGQGDLMGGGGGGGNRPVIRFGFRPAEEKEPVADEVAADPAEADEDKHGPREPVRYRVTYRDSKGVQVGDEKLYTPQQGTRDRLSGALTRLECFTLGVVPLPARAFSVKDSKGQPTCRSAHGSGWVVGNEDGVETVFFQEPVWWPQVVEAKYLGLVDPLVYFPGGWVGPQDRGGEYLEAWLQCPPLREQHRESCLGIIKSVQRVPLGDRIPVPISGPSCLRTTTATLFSSRMPGDTSDANLSWTDMVKDTFNSVITYWGAKRTFTGKTREIWENKAANNKTLVGLFGIKCYAQKVEKHTQMAEIMSREEEVRVYPELIRFLNTEPAMRSVTTGNIDPVTRVYRYTKNALTGYIYTVGQHERYNLFSRQKDVMYNSIAVALQQKVIAQMDLNKAIPTRSHLATAIPKVQ